MEGWIVIPNWDKFQHYKDRVPVWIKVYVELADKPEFEQLGANERGHLMTIWLEYARHRGVCSVEVVRKSCRRSYRVASMVSLNEAGFIRVVASKPLALRSKEVREETPKPPYAKTAQTPSAKAEVCPQCGLAFKTPARLHEHLEVVHWEYASP